MGVVWGGAGDGVDMNRMELRMAPFNFCLHLFADKTSVRNGNSCAWFLCCFSPVGFIMFLGPQILSLQLSHGNERCLMRIFDDILMP